MTLGGADATREEGGADIRSVFSQCSCCAEFLLKHKLKLSFKPLKSLASCRLIFCPKKLQSSYVFHATNQQGFLLIKQATQKRLHTLVDTIPPFWPQLSRKFSN